MALQRRSLLTGGLLAGAGLAVGLTADEMPRLWGPDRLPLDGGYAPAGNALGRSARGMVRTIWHVPTKQPWVALTFDDGPAADWTPEVLDTLERHDAAATFFVVGERLQRNASMVQGRYEGHEVGNHTWSHKDLAERDVGQVRDQLKRCHDTIADVIGKAPTIMRPPWGHTGGTTLTVADELGYDLIMWSYLMPEERFIANPSAIVTDVVESVQPGSVLLAHDVGDRKRKVTIDNLDAIIDGLRERGLTLVTVSQLLTAAI